MSEAPLATDSRWRNVAGAATTYLVVRHSRVSLGVRVEHADHERLDLRVAKVAHMSTSAPDVLVDVVEQHVL
jgi:hypothetical protein